jgi:predicted nucleic-acid-binding protein
MNRESLDTNILLRLLLQDNNKQFKIASKLIRGDKTYDVADVVFVELEQVLHFYYGFSRADRVTTIGNIFLIENINFNKDAIIPALKNYKEYPSLSFIDCLLAEYARINGSEPLWTFDKKLAKQSAAAKLAA